MMDKSVNLDRAVEVFVQAIRGTDAYRNYERYANEISKQPELKKQIDEYRLKNYELQITSEDGDALLEEQEQMLKEYEELSATPGVYEFLEAEVEFCRMMQALNTRVIEGVGFTT